MRVGGQIQKFAVSEEMKHPVLQWGITMNYIMVPTKKNWVVYTNPVVYINNSSFYSKSKNRYLL